MRKQYNEFGNFEWSSYQQLADDAWKWLGLTGAMEVVKDLCWAGFHFLLAELFLIASDLVAVLQMLRHGSEIFEACW